jgi:hypothetical protein
VEDPNPVPGRLVRIPKIRNRLRYQLKDRIGDQRGGSEWEPKKILLKELGLCPKIKPMKPTLAQLNR